jgi:hypothetical protein
MVPARRELIPAHLPWFSVSSFCFEFRVSSFKFRAFGNPLRREKLRIQMHDITGFVLFPQRWRHASYLEPPASNN